MFNFLSQEKRRNRRRVQHHSTERERERAQRGQRGLVIWGPTAFPHASRTRFTCITVTFDPVIYFTELNQQCTRKCM